MDESNSLTPDGSFKEINLPSPTLISKLAVLLLVVVVSPFPRLFLVTVAMTDPTSVVSKGDPLRELKRINMNIYKKERVKGDAQPAKKKQGHKKKQKEFVTYKIPSPLTTVRMAEPGTRLGPRDRVGAGVSATAM